LFGNCALTLRRDYRVCYICSYRERVLYDLLLLAEASGPICSLPDPQMMAGRNHCSGRGGVDYLLNDRQRVRSSCPQTWKFAVAVLLVCALFLIGVVIGYCISQAALGRRLDGSCRASQQSGRRQDASDDSEELFTDPRQIKLRHWDLVSHLQTADYSLPADLM